MLSLYHIFLHLQTKIDKYVSKYYVLLFLAAGIVCFEMRLGCMNGGAEEERAQAMVNANKVMFNLSAQLKFSFPLYKYIFTPKWKKLVEAEDFFYR